MTPGTYLPDSSRGYHVEGDRARALSRWLMAVEGVHEIVQELADQDGANDVSAFAVANALSPILGEIAQLMDEAEIRQAQPKEKKR